MGYFCQGIFSGIQPSEILFEIPPEQPAEILFRKTLRITSACGVNRIDSFDIIRAINR